MGHQRIDERPCPPHRILRLRLPIRRRLWIRLRIPIWRRLLRWLRRAQPLRVWIPILRLLRWVRWIRRVWPLRIWWSWIPIRWLWRIWPLWLWIPILLLLLLKCSTLGAESPAHDAAAWGMISRKCRTACQDSVMLKHPGFQGMIITTSIYQLTYQFASKHRKKTVLWCPLDCENEIK